ncbi:acyltransferase family protein [Pseudomonas atacamensis]|uniref:acyltransferase family protein n=1 Tax=Pseudomonas atacamensis TaxID=2565368 RepID=UPI002480A822|nr:acyltransferase [Pseudomonas atacamensis]WGT34104.1 acyltransferase [Pseudomonas atacamensis]
MHATVKLDALTSLRFFAAAMIVLGHTHGAFGSLGLATTLSLAQGVSFFFVLSGFILAYNYPTLATRQETVHFFKARIARIWPAHIAAIILLYLLTSGWNLGGLTYLQAIFTALANLFLIQSLIPLRDVFLTFNGVAWSISTEMFFYFSFPLLISSFIPGWKVKLIFLSTVAALFFGFAIAWNVPADDAAPSVSLMGLFYVNPFVRIIEFFAGVLACGVYQKIHSRTKNQSGLLFSAAELLVVVLAVFAMWITPKLTTIFAMHGAIGGAVNYYLIKSGSFLFFAALIVVFALGKGVFSKALSAPFLVLLGEISFSLYLVHMTVFQWYMANSLYFSHLPLLVQTTGYWAIALSLAFLLHKAVENPCRKLILSVNKTTIPIALSTAYNVRASAYLAAAGALILALNVLPAAFAPKGCQSDECTYLVKNHALTSSPEFGENLRLVAAKSVKTSSGGDNIELAFELIKPLPKGYILAVHLLDKNAEILDKSDTALSKSEKLRPGDQWTEVVTLTAGLSKPSPQMLGLAVYLDPASPIAVHSKVSDYNGRRALLQLSNIQSN